jgi:ankyrin repeat protein
MENVEQYSIYEILTMSPYEAHSAMINEIKKADPNTETINTILSESLIDVNAKDLGNTILIEAVKNKSFEVFLQILKHPNIDINAEGEGGITPLIALIGKKKKKFFKELIKHPDIDVNYESEGGITPLILSIRYNDNGLFLDLLKHPGIDINYQNKFGMTALHWAVVQKKEKMIETLLNDSRIDVSLKNVRNKTAADFIEKDSDYKIKFPQLIID